MLVFRKLPTALVYPINSKDKPDWRTILSHLLKQGKLKKTDLLRLLYQGIQTLALQKNIIQIDDPVLVIGDLHGQFYDLVRIIQSCGSPINIKYVFLGDYVDRGYFSIQLMIFLLALKCALPKQIILLRGNHQSRHMTSFFNFRSQCLSKYDQEIYELFIQSFQAMPLAAILNKKFLLVHGGIPYNIEHIEQIFYIKRKRQVPIYGAMCDLLWSDPSQVVSYFKQNDVRNCSYYYGYSAIKKFLQKNKLLSIIRAHQVQSDGYKLHRFGKHVQFPPVITIFSASNYCQIFGNKGAVMKLSKNSFQILQHQNVEKPYVFPYFMDALEWSIPIVLQAISQIFNHLLYRINSIRSKHKLAESFRTKTMCIGKLMMIYKKVSNQRKSYLKYKKSPPDINCLNQKVLQMQIEQVIAKSRQIDKPNQSRP